MKPLRKNVAIAIDGGGIRGIIPAKALTMLEAEVGKPVNQIFRLCAGTSTGSILAAGIASGADAKSLLEMYIQLGPRLFRRSFWTWMWLFRGYRYSRQPLIKQFGEMLQGKTLGDLWNAFPSTALVTTTYDLVSNRTRFVKSWKEEYQEWSVINAVIASSAAPTYLPVMDGRYTDGGVGSYNNPCFLAAYELTQFLGWKHSETTLISLGTGRAPEHVKVGEPDRYNALQWLPRVLETHAQDASDQQVILVKTMYPELDFRRYQVDLEKTIAVDDYSRTSELLAYGEEMGTRLLKDRVDAAQRVGVPRAPKMNLTRATKSTSRRQTSKTGSRKK